MAKRLMILVILLLVSMPAFAESVDTAWVRRYNGPGNSYDEALAMVVDEAGNIYVTGYSYSAGTFSDYATLKYNPDGDTLWVRAYNGPGNGPDWACAIATGASGNAYVTGFSWGSGTSSDYATIKYYPDGDTAWIRILILGVGQFRQQCSCRRGSWNNPSLRATTLIVSY